MGVNFNCHIAIYITKYITIAKTSTNIACDIDISKSDLVNIWKHSRNKIKTDYWVRDAQARLSTKYRNDMVQG